MHGVHCSFLLVTPPASPLPFSAICHPPDTTKPRSSRSTAERPAAGTRLNQGVVNGRPRTLREIAQNIEILNRKSDGIIIIACPGTHGGYDKRDGRAFVMQLPNGALAMGCLHSTCSLANTNGNRWHEFRQLVEGIKPPAGKKPVHPRDAQVPLRFSEDALALRFTERHVDDLRYVARWGKWLRYDGTRWKEDAVLDVFDKCRVVCREASEECLREGNVSLAKQLVDASTIAAVHRLATSDQKTAGTSDQWDAGVWLLNTPGGAVDVCTGQIRPCVREDYCTRISAMGGSMNAASRTKPTIAAITPDMLGNLAGFNF